MPANHHTNLINSPDPAKANQVNFKFIDNIRFISMMAIVMEHSSGFWSQRFPFFSDKVIQTLSVQFFKFGTIIFFLLAGFLIGDKIKTYSPRQYIQRRIGNTVKPWLFWVSILLFLNYLQRFIRYFKKPDASIFKPALEDLLHEITHIVFYTSFWFIINFVICIAILLIFRKHLYKISLGIILGLMSVFYSANLYFHWIGTEHTTALFGFVFYLWLGVKLNKYYEVFVQWVNKINPLLLWSFFLFALALSCYESIQLLTIMPDDPFNTLRISNIFYSLICFLLLFRFGDIRWISRINPRSTTFGIYLIHQILIFHFLPYIFRPLHLNIDNPSAFYLLCMQLLRFAIVYPLSYYLITLITKSAKLKWIIGQ